VRRHLWASRLTNGPTARSGPDTAVLAPVAIRPKNSLGWRREPGQAAQDPARTATQRKVIQGTAGYYRRNAPYMHYDTYLACGWPVGTGVVEGAGGHLVKDRMEQAGMRWTKAGAQAVLDLRALRLNGQWDAYGPFHRQRHHERL